MGFARKLHRRKEKKRQLVGFYWGYKANEGLNGFEFTSQHCRQMGMNSKAIQELGKIIKNTADEQVRYIKSNITKEEKEKYICEEQARLEQAVRNMRDIVTAHGMNGQIDFEQVLPDIIMGCCAISTLVASGHIKQDEWNGDRFFEAIKTR